MVVWLRFTLVLLVFLWLVAVELAPLRSVVGTLRTGVRLPSSVGNDCVWGGQCCLLSGRYTCWDCCCCQDRSLSGIVDRRVSEEFPSSVVYANPEPVCGLFSLSDALLSALNAAWMTLSAAALAADIIALGLSKTTSSSIWIMALFHAVAMLLLTLSKVSVMRRKVMRSSLSSSLVGGFGAG